jgi:hypothetical protein
VHSVSRRPPEAAALYPREPDRGKSHPWRVFSAAASLNTATPNPAATKASALAAPSPSWTLRALLGILLLGFSVALFAGWRLDVRAAKATKLPVNFHLMVWPTITLFLLGGVILV